MKIFILYIILLFKLFNANAEIVKVSEEELIIKKSILNGDSDVFKAALNTNIKKITIDNCYGGIVSETHKISRLIYKNKLNTNLIGTAGSGCAIAFLSGYKRKIDTKYLGDSVIMVHGAYNLATGQAVKPEVNIELLKIREEDFGIRFSESVKEIIINTKNKNEGVYFFYSPKKNIYQTFHCKDSYIKEPTSCRLLDGISMITEKLVTP